jgi:hydroxymethylglutaryl-CoA lyase/(R)-citramalyl-CoA lyase
VTPVICDVGPRDGLQNDPVLLEPAVRADLCARLAASALPVVEAASFVNPKLVPAMAGAEEVVAALPAAIGTTWAGLVLNERGLERALASGLREIHATHAVTDGFARANQNTTAAEAAAASARIVAAGHAAGARVSVTLSCSFGCPFDGRVDEGVVLEHVRGAAAAGADEVVLADTIGVGVPSQVRRLVTAATGETAVVGGHFHNTRNTGYANALAALESGATVLDASVGGLGGCPFAPNATGNIATEDLVYLLEREGVATGVDLDALLGVARWLTQRLGHDLPGLLHRAGAW